jgi:hypothetical protein
MVSVVAKLRTHLLLVALASAISASASQGNEARGRQFVSFTSFNSFARETEPNSSETVFTSPFISTKIKFNEVVVSWNTCLPPDSSLTIEARAAASAEKTTKFYTLGCWSSNRGRYPRHSVADQKDGDGDVDTDTLALHWPADRLQVRLTIAGAPLPQPPVKFLGISLADTSVSFEPLPPLRRAWGKLILVPERTQMIYPGGNVLCSPTTVSMLLGYWAQTLQRPELDKPVPEIADAIYDSQWHGTGNWPFNMAYAGSFPRLRAYVARLSDIFELEAWIVRRIPLGLSVDYDRLRGKGPGPNGHLVALVGFTKQGDPIINDPGTSQHVRKVFPRQNLREAWACSRNTVYLVYPETAPLPTDRFGHWCSPSTIYKPKSDK